MKESAVPDDAMLASVIADCPTATFKPGTKGLQCSHLYVESSKHDKKFVFSMGFRKIPLDDFSYCK